MDLVERTRAFRSHAGVIVATVSILAITALLLWLEGRLWWCACARPRLWISEAWGTETSQHLFDPYSFTHLLHGIVFCWVLGLLGRRIPAKWQFVIALIVEAAWEIFENSPFIIDRYRAAAALGYTGDTIVNSLGDVISCAVGFGLAHRLRARWSAVVFAATEVLLLVCIRDSLLLNVVMLVHPIEAIKRWQLGG
jgi:hypothetical protein